jgi:hypothetical protein
MWVIGEGLVESNGFDWDLSHAIPMTLFDNSNPNIYVADITRTSSADAVLKVLKDLSWSGEIGWTSLLDVDKIGTNDFTLSTASSRSFLLITGHSGEKYTVKIDIFLNKGIAVKKP